MYCIVKDILIICVLYSEGYHEDVYCIVKDIMRICVLYSEGYHEDMCIV